MADGATELRRQIARLRELGNLTTVSAPAVARTVKAETLKQTRKGVGPDGKAWTPIKTGERPFKNVAQNLKVSAIGSTVVMILTKHHARHHLGAVKGGIKRPIIPTDKIPEPMTRAITRVATGEFHRIMETES